VSFHRGAMGPVMVVATAVTALVVPSTVARASLDRPVVLSAADCAGKPKGHVVQWYSLGSSPLATIPLRCGEKNRFGLLKIVGKHPAPTLDADIADTLINYDHEQRQPPSSVAYSRSDLPPCPGHFRVVVQFGSYGSTGIKGIITAFQSPDPAPGQARGTDSGPQAVRLAQESC
jgi:hypothetical protein